MAELNKTPKINCSSYQVANLETPRLSIDEVELTVFGSTIRMVRKTTIDIPAEVSAFIPRAELRKRRYANGQLVCEDEVILNSITVVHAPRHPLHEGEGLPSPELPQKPDQSEKELWKTADLKSINEPRLSGEKWSRRWGRWFLKKIGVN